MYSLPCVYVPPALIVTTNIFALSPEAERQRCSGLLRGHVTDIHPAATCLYPGMQPLLDVQMMRV